METTTMGKTYESIFPSSLNFYKVIFRLQQTEVRSKQDQNRIKTKPLLQI